MGLTLSHDTALDLLRRARIDAGEKGISIAPGDFIPPDPGEGHRWSNDLVQTTRQAVGVPFGRRLDVLATDVKHRPRHRDLRCHMWGANVSGLCFLELVPGQIAIPSAEILLAEMGEVLPLPDLVALGHELCGSYTLQPSFSGGAAIIGTPSVTSTEKIRSTLGHSSRLRGSKALAKALPYIQDGSVSPAETALSTISQIPVGDGGYEMGPTILNKAVVPDEGQRAAVLAEQRVPDILFAGTTVGLNYDGEIHLGLSQVVRSAKALAKDPESDELQATFDQAIDDVRKGWASDKQRDRDLAAMGLTVLPVTRLDIGDIKDLDRVMRQVMCIIEQTTERDLSFQRRALSDEGLKAERERVLVRLFKA